MTKWEDWALVSFIFDQDQRALVNECVSVCVAYDFMCEIDIGRLFCSCIFCLLRESLDEQS